MSLANKNNFFVTLCCISLAVFSSTSFGQDTSSFCANKDTAIYFGNGVDTTRTQAKVALIWLENAVQQQYSESEFETIEFKLAYNHTGNLLIDLLESVAQDLATDTTSFWRMLARLSPFSTEFENKLLELASAIDEAALVSSSDLSTHLTSYRQDILGGKKVILVSHSQGNFFANFAYGNLNTSEKSSFGIVSVANPDSFVAGGGPYTTLFEDLVIQAIRLAKAAANLPAPLPANFTNLFVSADAFGHGFTQAYLLPDTGSEARIMSNIVSARAGLTPPPTSSGQGIITVTLTWGAQPDVDLHVFEPNGTHVYYANKNGISGYLDVDDVTSYGPEHYYVGCDTLETGTYRIGVNYYFGSAPETASVLIQAGLESQGRSIFLPSALGASGNATPISAGTIVVTGSEEEGYDFTIN